MTTDEIDNPTIVRTLYKALLNRDPDPAGFAHYLSMLDSGQTTPHEAALDCVGSTEFLQQIHRMGWEIISRTDYRLYAGYKPEDLAVFDHFSHAQPHPRNGFLTEFIGSRARITSLWDECRVLEGKVLPLPIPCDYQSDVIEWLGMLKAVLAANGSFAAMELGAGHGPWIAASAAAARLRGINQLSLCAVEGDPGRFAFLQQNIEDNDLTTQDLILLHAAVGIADGSARWPRVPDPRNAGGARPFRDGNLEEEAYLAYLGDWTRDRVEVEVVSASRLLLSRPSWDFVHIDVQGTEAELCRGCLSVLSERVRYLVVGTHSRKLDGELIELLLTGGWRLEHERPARMICGSAASMITLTTHDGTQVWRNPRL